MNIAILQDTYLNKIVSSSCDYEDTYVLAKFDINHSRCYHFNYETCSSHLYCHSHSNTNSNTNIKHANVNNI